VFVRSSAYRFWFLGGQLRHRPPSALKGQIATDRQRQFAVDKLPFMPTIAN
jgi:hypothetical protein